MNNQRICVDDGGLGEYLFGPAVSVRPKWFGKTARTLLPACSIRRNHKYLGPSGARG